MVALAVFHSSYQLSCPTNETANITLCLKSAESCVKITRFIDTVAETFSLSNYFFFVFLFSDTLDTDKETLIFFFSLINTDTFQGLHTYSVLSACQQMAIKVVSTVTLIESQLIFLKMSNFFGKIGITCVISSMI